MGSHILVIDQTTVSSQAVVFDADQHVVGTAKVELTQNYPEAEWVEQIPEEIWATCLWACKAALRKANISARDLAGIGIANQRATSIVWDRATGEAIYNAIVWRDLRTGGDCIGLKQAGHEETVSARTGLLIDPYFSALKIKWILDQVEGARERAQRGELAFGTVDSFLIWKLTGGRVHATDATNASQTSLFNLRSNDWDPDMLALFDVPAEILPEVKDSADDFGTVEPHVLGAAVPILGVVGNQQASLIGQACFSPGMLKASYGTHCFAMLNTGDDIVRSGHRLLTTIGYRIGGRSTFALEGAIVMVGGSLQWLHDDLGIIEQWGQVDRMAESSDFTRPVYLVPAFVGAGSNWGEAEAQGALFGIGRDTRRPELVRAALEAVGYQSNDLIDTMRQDWGKDGEVIIRVDGGLAASDWTMQFLAGITGTVVDRPRETEIAALGAAWLVAQRVGLWPDEAGFSARRAIDRQFQPRMPAPMRQDKLKGWRDAVRRTLPAALNG